VLVGKFSDRVAKTSTAADIAADQFLNAGARFEAFLLARGESPERAAEQRLALSLFMAKHMPDIGVLSAVQDLRELAGSSKAESKGKYPGRRKCDIAPVDYLLANYGDEIRDGRLTPGRLSAIDSYLYQAVRVQLWRDPTIKTVTELFDTIRPESMRVDRTTRRDKACAQILGTTELEASRFFELVRSTRYSPKTDSEPSR